MQMIRSRIASAYKNRIIAPNDTLTADPLRKFLNTASKCFLPGSPSSISFPYPVSVNMKIIRICLKLRKTAKHSFRIFCPEYNAVHYGRRQWNPADSVGIHRIAHADKAFAQTAIKPGCIILGNIRPSAGAQNHNPHLLISAHQSRYRFSLRLKHAV